MSSILTNSSANVALQTLKSINSDLNKVQSEISTGMSVSSAKDNASVFAISKVMEADVAGFEAVSESLALGQSTVAVAASAAEEIGELLNEVKTKIVSANEDNVDRNKLNSEVQSLVEQITGIVDSAQFNGLNILDGSKDGNGGFSVLSSLNRSADGSVSTGSISFDPSLTNLSTKSGTDLSAGTNPATNLTTPASYTSADIGPDQSTIATISGANGFGLSQASGATSQFVIGDFELLASNGSLGGGVALAASDVDLSAGTASGGLVAGDKVSLTLGNTVATYTIGVGDRTEDIASGLRSSLIAAGLDQSDFTLDTNDSPGSLTIDNNTEQTVNGYYQITRSSGGLAGLDTLDVSTATGASAALSRIETYIQTAVDSQAQLGTTEKRLEIQSNFMTKLVDSFNNGIGSLVDADMEEASARLKALQTQQQLGVQALSIANQAPETLMSLFR